MATSAKLSTTQKTVLISLVSEQTLPNVLFIRQFGAEADALCFLNTTRFKNEGRVNWILEGAGIEGKDCYELLLDPEDPGKSLEELGKFDWRQFDTYTINLTGGTKMMALAVYSFFSSRFEEASAIYYIPVFQNQCLQIFPESDIIPLTPKILIRDYLKSYGIMIVKEQNYHLQKETSQLAQDIFDRLVIKQDPLVLHTIQHAHEIADLKVRAIYQGEWLEIWLANQIHQLLQIPKTQILQGIRINKNGMPDNANNEFDVLFQWENRLFVGECKFYNKGKFKMSGSTGSSRDIFKLGNLKSNFGLHAVPFILTANSTQYVPQYAHACNFYGIRGTADIRILRNHGGFEKFLSDLVSNK